jgi:thiamine pyrophosphokinase
MTLKKFKKLPDGTLLKDKEGVEWLKVSDGIKCVVDGAFIPWYWIGDFKSLVIMK